ncbi:hypothetical protein D6D19_10178 [Aureobasidium pullulans]|uniref:Carboxylic ester hydrolase n=1 Tax=Aureobasidium pullulans TaxID=5580 RepID=A0A4S8YY81_AURPU|nr:hypothetical protein D6D19_10178 [Aureobasidium pullulans]
MQPLHDYRKIVVEVPTATTPSRIQVVIGVKSETENIEEFRGIPYGQVNARWEHSSVRDSLPSDVFRALQNGPRCPQPVEPNNTATFQAHLDFPSDVEESEFDCLNLFIIRPSSRSGKHTNLPVYLYIHGGGYGFGAGSDPMWSKSPVYIRFSIELARHPTTFVAQSLANGKPIIAVNINYRLNVFGFGCSDSIIATQNASSPIKGGNFGLGDQRRALEWVVRNIGHFGGDNERITIGGQSAGASSVHAHVIDAKLNSGLSGPLFRRAIMQSGAVGTLGPIALSKASANFDLLRKEYSDLDITGLKTISSRDLLEKTKRLGWWVYPLVNDGLTISPSNIGRWNVSLGVHDESQREYPQRGREETLRVLLGDTDAEASIWKDAIENVETYTELEVLVRPNVTEDVWVQLRKLYKWDASASIRQIHESLTQFLTDIEFGNPVHLARTELASAKQEEEAGVLPSSTQSYRCRFGNPWPGPTHGTAHHCVDLIYIFNCFNDLLVKADGSNLENTTRNQDLVRTMQKHWLDFIYDDEPALIAEEQFIVYGKDTLTTVVDSVDDHEIQARLCRFKLINAHRDMITKASHLITGVTVV